LNGSLRAGSPIVNMTGGRWGEDVEPVDAPAKWGLVGPLVGMR
jgi:hypothetical protein